MARALSHRRRLRTIGALLGSCLLATGCAPSAALDAGNGEKFTVVATTPILADLARNIAGEDARVQSLIPSGKDPHTFEPTLRTVRDAVSYTHLTLPTILLV